MLLPRVSAGRLLTPEVRQYIHSRDWPKALQFRLKEEWAGIYVIFYRDNFSTLDGEDQKQIAMTMKECMEKIRADGIPIFLEVKATKEEQGA